MSKPYSLDLRERVVDAVEETGLSRREAAAHFGVGVRTAIECGRRSPYSAGGRFNMLAGREASMQVSFDYLARARNELKWIAVADCV